MLFFFIFFFFLLLSSSDVTAQCGAPLPVLTREAARRLRVRGLGVLLVLVGGQLHPLLVHALGLHPLDEAEEVFVRHCGGVRTGFRRGAPLIVDPGGLHGDIPWLITDLVPLLDFHPIQSNAQAGFANSDNHSNNIIISYLLLSSISYS